MNPFQGNIITKLPQTGTSIFAVMSQLANEYKAVNLSQGFPDFPISEELIELVNHFMKEIVKYSEVVECFHLTGAFDFQLKVYVRDMDEYQKFILNKLSVIKNIGHIESYFVMTEVKNTTCLPIY